MIESANMRKITIEWRGVIVTTLLYVPIITILDTMMTIKSMRGSKRKSPNTI